MQTSDSGSTPAKSNSKGKTASTEDSEQVTGISHERFVYPRLLIYTMPLSFGAEQL